MSQNGAGSVPISEDPVRATELYVERASEQWESHSCCGRAVIKITSKSLVRPFPTVTRKMFVMDIERQLPGDNAAGCSWPGAPTERTQISACSRSVLAACRRPLPRSSEVWGKTVSQAYLMRDQRARLC